MPPDFNLQKKLSQYSIGALLIISLLYGCFRIYPLIAGPSVIIYNPHDGDIVSSSTFEVSGQVARVKEITLQGRPIPIGTDGHFAEVITAQAPYSVLVVTATDFYGKTVTKTVRVLPK